MPSPLTSLAAAALLCATAVPAFSAEVDMVAIFAKAAEARQVGVAKKTKAVDARPATAGEVVVTIIKSEGVETRSKPAEAGDYVVRNRCPATGNEEYLVKGPKFGPRYTDAGKPADAAGWKEYTPLGPDMSYFIIPAGQGPYEFKAPWGETMVAKAGDAIVQDPKDAKDTYRIAAAAFDCTYEIVRKP